MKRFFLAIGILVVLLTASIFAAYFWYTNSLSSVSNSDQKISFVVKEKESGLLILSELESKQLIKSALAARIYLRLNNRSQSIRPGAYVLSPNLSFPQVFSLLVAGPKDIWVTFPEGWRREQIADRLQSAYSQVPNSKFVLTDFLALTHNLEGQLFPDTYLVPTTASTADVVRIMTTNFQKKTGLTLPADKETLIVASLVEREARSADERAVIAGIIKNRLDKGWSLDIDATVQYGVDSVSQPDKYWQPLTDSKFASPYNTYLNPGLPPGAICNPGLGSINAAKNPEPSLYMFYLHDNSGQIHYAPTLQEHNSNVDKYLR